MAVNFLRGIWLQEVDERVHAQFVRFSRGIFENRAVISVAVSNEVKIGSTFEMANDFVLFIAGLSDKFSVSGILFARENPQELLDSLGFKAEVRRKKSIFEAEIDCEMNSEQLKKIAGMAYFMLLDIHAEDISLKVKKRLPKPGKSGKEKVDDKFCILGLDKRFYSQFHDEFLFDLPLEFKKARVRHTFIISDIILPKGEKDFELIRLNAKRKGKIARCAEVDGRVMQQEKDFEA